MLDGVKLWTTNGVIAELLVVMAAVPKHDGGRGGITAFVVEADSPRHHGGEPQRVHGPEGIENGVTRFHQVRVPAANRLGKEGEGLKIALTTLNTGRLSIPAMCAAAGKWCAQDRPRVVGRARPVGQAGRRARGGREQAVVHGGHDLRARGRARPVRPARRRRHQGHPDRGRAGQALGRARWRARSPTSWSRSAAGRGFETADSLAARGERAVPAEQILRDLRINRIFEGSSEIMRLLIAREAVDAHLKAAGDLASLDADSPGEGQGGRQGQRASTPGGFRSWWSARARSRRRTTSSAGWPSTCGSSSGRRASWPARRSTA